MARSLTDYEILDKSSPEAHRLLRQEELLVDAQEEIATQLHDQGIKYAELASRLDWPSRWVQSLLDEGSDIDCLRVLADVATALGCRAHIKFERDDRAA